MKTKFVLLFAMFLIGFYNLNAQNSCSDIGRYVNSKNTGQTGLFTLELGDEEEAAQTYRYSGPGVVNGVRVYGNFPAPIGGVPLAVTFYNVDAAGRPTSAVQTVNTTWWAGQHNAPGYIDVTFPGGGVYASANFALGVRVRSAFPWGGIFRVGYTGDGEGLGEDLASVAGTSTGFNWTSAKNNFAKDGDFYIEPRITHFITSAFTVNNKCVSAGQTVSFTNTSSVTKDPMFNQILAQGYSGGQALFTWSFGDGSPVSNAVNPTHTYTAAGVYTVTLTTKIDGWNSDCNDVFTTQISVGLTASAPTVTNLTCFGSNNGSATANVAGGAQPYTYSLTGGDDAFYQSSSTFGSLTAGSYTMYVKDNVGCVKTVGFTVTQPSAIVFSSIVPTTADCGNSNGAITVTATGGSGSIQYKLNDGNYQSSGSFSNLSAGAYTITAKDANNCTGATLVSINNVSAPVLSLLSSTSVSCNGGSDGSIVVIGNGGVGTLQYSLNGDDFQTSGTFSNVPAGIYPVTVKDATGCTRVLTVTITEPAPLSISAKGVATSCNGGNDGRIEVVAASGGIGTLTYSLNGVNYQSGTVFSGLVPNNYTVYVRDIAGCTATTSVTVGQPAIIGITTFITNASCNGFNNGSITVIATGGTGKYMYSIDGVNYQPTNVFSELSARNYSVYVKDQNNCVIVKLNNFVTEPTKVEGVATTGSSTCGNNNGSILVSASGGSGNGYQFSLDGINYNSTGLFNNLGAGTYYILILDDASCGTIIAATIEDLDGPSIVGVSSTNISCNGGNDGTITINSVTGGTGQITYSINGSTFQTSNVFTGLTAGTYTIVVRDVNGCTGSVSRTLLEPNAIVINTTATDATCFGGNNGAIQVVASGGAGTLAYSIDFGLTYQSSSVFSGLNAGTYVVVVRDAGGCLNNQSIRINQPAKINISVGVLNVTCRNAADGAIAVTAWGGTGALQYSLDGTTYQSSNVFTGLSGGAYIVRVKDANNCVEFQNTLVVEPALLKAVGTTSNVSCAGGNNGVIDLTVSGGTLPYNFIWSNSATTEDNFNLSEGTYTVYISDANGCLFSDDYSITEPANPIIVNGVVADATDSLTLNGAIDITVTGGTSPYTYAWSTGATSQDVSGLAAGNYSVTVKDVNNCVTSNSFTVAGYTSVAEISVIKNSTSLYPNPASNFTVVEAVGFEINTVQVYDLTGRLVFESTPNTSKENINTAEFTNGMYYVRIGVNNNFITKKLEIIK